MSSPPILYPSRPIRVHSLDQIRKKDPQTWRLQFKWGGHHAIVATHTNEYIFSRHGAPLSSAAKTDFSSRCARIFGLDCVLDGELLLPSVSGVKEPEFVIFDMPVHNGRDLTRVNYAGRMAVLKQYQSDLTPPGLVGRVKVHHGIYICGLHTMDQLDAMIQHCDGRLLEGVVAKNLAHDLSWSRIAQLECTQAIKYRIK